jgi:hypothetical protein
MTGQSSTEFAVLALDKNDLHLRESDAFSRGREACVAALMS